VSLIEKYTSGGLLTVLLGIVAGPLIGGALTEHVSWRWCEYLILLLPRTALLTVDRLLHQLAYRRLSSSHLCDHPRPRQCQERVLLVCSSAQKHSATRSHWLRIIRPAVHHVSPGAAVWLGQCLRLGQRHYHRIVRWCWSWDHHLHILGASHGRRSHAAR
jgi:MFS family permease